MKNKIDWSTYKFRSSQVHKLLTGTIVNDAELDVKINELVNKRDVLVHENKRLKWTDTNISDLAKLIEKKNLPVFSRLPKTMISELRKIHRAETFGRNFSFTNKYVQKGIEQEEAAITIYQYYRNRVLKIPTFFINNKERLYNDWISGEADLTDTNNFKECNEGYDTKCSWELDTFPFPEDVLDPSYEVQNQCYMWLSSTGKWITASVLVNCTERLLDNEKKKWFYSMGSPMNEDDKNYSEYIEKAKETEKKLIFEYDKFVSDNPGHLLEITREEWYENDYDIPLKDRVIEKHSVRNESTIEEIKTRITISRDYLAHLSK
tara:strand:+ start:472 stop:1431 length:960 start_codon:yes stop_codon:yes gene_type:complete